MPKVSVIIPVYNVEKYLRACIESVFAQSYKDYEIILVDDGSTDSSGAICDEFAENNPAVRVIHQQNKGLGGARNTGIYASESDYLLFVDSDDTVHPELLEICCEKIEKYSCDMVIFDLIAAFDDGTFGEKFTCSPILENTSLSGDNLKPLAFVTGACNRIFKKSLFTENNIEFPNKVWYEDLRTVGKLVPYVEKAYYYSKKPLYYYFQRTGSIMHTPDFNRIVTERILAVNEIWNFFSEHNYIERYKEEIEYLLIFHGFFLPVREIQSMTNDFSNYIDKLRNNLEEHCINPLQNKYISILKTKGCLILKLAYNRNYTLIKAFSALNRTIKKVKNVK